MKIHVVGAGIGGLTAALALARYGFEVIVVEREAGPVESGAGIQLGPNAIKVLRSIGLDTKLVARAFVPANLIVRHHQTAQPLLRLPLQELCEQRFGAPYLQTQRRTLVQVLSEAASVAGAQILYNHELQSWHQSGEGVNLQFTDGATLRTDLLVGADGLHSQTRAAMPAKRDPLPSGQVVWRGQASEATLAAKLSPDANIWLGAARHFVAYHLGDGNNINCVAAFARQVAPSAWRNQPEDTAKVSAAFTDWDPLVIALIEACTDWRWWEMFELPELERWSDGRVVLLGDACHPMLPYQAQGAAAAIESAYVLAAACKHLADDSHQHQQDITAALNAYEAARKPRVRFLQQVSRNNAKFFHLNAAPLRLGRRLLLGIANKLPALGNWHLDRIYGFDVTGKDGIGHK